MYWGGDMLGIGPNDSPGFKLFKLAGFGLKMLCGGLKDKQRGGLRRIQLGYRRSTWFDIVTWNQLRFTCSFKIYI